jgi:ketosteroid isomerase-like protein
MAAVWRDAANVWAGYRSEAEAFQELDGERVLVLMRQHGRGKASGLDLGEMRTKAATVFHLREGKVTRIVRYWDRDRALADLGLAPEGEAP